MWVNITCLDVFRIHVIAVRSIIKRDFVVNDIGHRQNNGTVVPAVPVLCYNTIAGSNGRKVDTTTSPHLSIET